MAKKKKKPNRSGLQPHRNTGPTIKRNQPCPCGSGQKAKRCCLPHVKMIAALPEHVRNSFLAANTLQRTPIGTVDEEVVIQEPDVEMTDCDIEICQDEVEST